MKDIYESEMNFGSFSEMDLFEIEKSQLLKKLGKGIKSVEFILLNKKRNINECFNQFSILHLCK